MASSRSPDAVIIIDDSSTGASIPAIMPVLTKYHEQGHSVLLWVHERRCGVAASWNQFFKDTTYDALIIANDDVIVHSDTIEILIKTAEAHPEHVFFTGSDLSGNAFSLFLLTRAGYNAIGEFDEMFFPAYFEDNDYSMRRKLAGFDHIIVADATYTHVGSATLHKYTQLEREQHHSFFRANKDYYKYKWGGEPHQELYSTPFNRT